MKTLIAYYSFTGNNAVLAAWLQKRMGADIYRIVEIKKRRKISILFDIFFHRNPSIAPSDIGIETYETVILAAPVWGAKIASPMRVFLELEKEKIHRYAFISLCNGVENQKETLAGELSGIIHEKPVTVTELWINDLLPPGEKNKVRQLFNFRITPGDVSRFEGRIESFIRTVGQGHAD
ncbi:MAG: hypothetical protein JW881_04450 [Spirochaetales bacterium]|nr:hypothetical protein [Spirochaetales bacterium]